MPDITLVLFIMLTVFGIIPLLLLFTVAGIIVISIVWTLDWADRKITYKLQNRADNGKRK